MTEAYPGALTFEALSFRNEVRNLHFAFGVAVERRYYVYIMSSRSRNLYTGVTNNLIRRTAQHKFATFPGFTARYRVHRLVYVEPFADIRNAIAREKQIKAFRREKKIALIEGLNPTWGDLAEPWFPKRQTSAEEKKMPEKKMQIPHPENQNRGSG